MRMTLETWKLRIEIGSLVRVEQVLAPTAADAIATGAVRFGYGKGIDTNPLLTDICHVGDYGVWMNDRWRNTYFSDTP